MSGPVYTTDVEASGGPPAGAPLLALSYRSHLTVSC